jgi:hypothetical protein
MLVAVLYDPDGRANNVRLVIEGPFVDAASAIDILKKVARKGQFSAASTRVLSVSSAQQFYAAMQDIRSALKQAISPR